MAGPSDTGGNVHRPPQELANNPALWESVMLASFGGATPTEQRALEMSIHKGFVDPSLTTAQRMHARDDAIRGLGYFGISFDWDAWRREMGYSA